MPEYDDMLQSLPAAYRQDRWVRGLLGAVEAEDGRQRADAWETAAQLLPDSMTWVLPVEERIAGLRPAQGAQAEERRAALVAKWRAGAGKCDLDMIRGVCGSWPGVTSEIRYDGLGAVVVVFRSPDTFRADADTVRRAVREIIPAHLRFDLFEVLKRDAAARVRTAAGGSRRQVHGEGTALLHRTAAAVKTGAAGSLRRGYPVIEVMGV